MQFQYYLSLCVCLVLFGFPQQAAQTPSVPKYYGVFLWDGQSLRELNRSSSRV